MNWHCLVALPALTMVFPAPVAFAADAPPPLWHGVWHGTIGTAAVQVCLQSDGLDNPFGAYYYMRHLGLISLGSLSQPSPDNAQVFTNKRPPIWTENRQPDHPEKGPLWSLTQTSSAQLSGSWRDGSKSLSIKLFRVAVENPAPDYVGDGPCGSLAFSLPRYRTPVITTTPATLDGTAYTNVLADAGKKSTGTSSFQLIGNTPAIARINKALYKDVPTGPANDMNFQCSMAGLGSNGMAGDAVSSTSPLIITKRWMVSETDSEDDCGGAHPNAGSSYTTWDMQKGTAVDLNTWFNAAALSVKRDSESDEYLTVTYTPAFRKLMNEAYVKARGVDTECQEAVEDTDLWDAHLDKDGVAFVPAMAHVDQACSDNAVIPFARLADYLSNKGRVGVALFIIEMKALHRKPQTEK